MKTLLECKDAIAHRHGYQSWGEMHVDLKDWKSRAHELAELYASQFREPSSPKENAELLDLVLDLFTQGCASNDGKYDHCCLSTYEAAQAFLIDKGIIKKEDCYRP